MQPIVSELLLEAYGLTMIKILLTGRGVMAVRHVSGFFFLNNRLFTRRVACKLFSFYYFFGFFFLFFNMISMFPHERTSANISVHMHL